MMQDEVNKIVFNALADGREIWFPESACLFLNFGVPGVHRLGSWNVLPGALPFSSPSSGAFP